MPALETCVTLPDQRTVPVSYKVFGEYSPDAPIGGVFANGLGCHPETTELPAEAVAEQGFRVVTFEPDTTARLTIADRVHIMSALGHEVLGNPYIAMGFGAGGDIATTVAYTDYEETEFAVAGLVNAAGSRELEALAARAPERAFVRGFMRPIFLDMLASSESEAIRAHGKHVAEMSPPELAAYHFGARDLIEQIGVFEDATLSQLLLYGGPAYFIHGDRIRPPHLDTIKDCRNIQVHRIADAGHFLHAEAPTEYAEVLTKAFAEINSR